MMEAWENACINKGAEGERDGQTPGCPFPFYKKLTDNVLPPRPVYRERAPATWSSTFGL